MWGVGIRNYDVFKRPPNMPPPPGIGFGFACATAGSTPGWVIEYLRQIILDAKLRSAEPTPGQNQSPGRTWLGLAIVLLLLLQKASVFPAVPTVIFNVVCGADQMILVRLKLQSRRRRLFELVLVGFSVKVCAWNLRPLLTCNMMQSQKKKRQQR